MHLFKLLSILLLLHCTGMVNAQEIHWQKDKPLTWKDFQGMPDPNSTYAAVTNSRIKYNFNNELKDTVYKITFKLENVFYTQTSWSKKDQRNKDLLHHEQLHFDINELFTRRRRYAQYVKEYSRRSGISKPNMIIKLSIRASRGRNLFGSNIYINCLQNYRLIIK
jgi:hypothetical protein